jgi:hypothetical protein
MIHELFSAYRRCNFKQQEFQQKVIPLVTESGRLVLHDGARFTKVADFWKKHAQTHLDENSSAEMIHRLPAMLEALQDKIQNKTFEEMVAAGFPGLSSLLPSRAGGG